MTYPTFVVTRERPLAGTGRLGILSAYFTLCAVGAAAITVGALIAVVRPSLGWHTIPQNPALAAVGGALLTFGFIRTDRLLRRRRRTGAYLAAGCLAMTLTSSFAGGWSWMATVVPIVGLGLCASVWRHLE